MHFVRATALFGALAVTIFAAGCSGGGGGATPPVSVPDQISTIDQPTNPGTLQTGTVSASSAQSTVSAPASGWNIHVQGKIVAIKSSTEFEINGGTGVGYLDVYLTSSTVKNYNGLAIKTGEYADVYGNGSVSTYVTATQVTLSTTSTFSTQSTSSAPASGWDIHVQGPIVAIKSSSEFEINGGTGVGYLNIYTTSSTVNILNGLTLSVGKYADVYGNGSKSTYVTATQITLSSSSTTTSATPAPTSAASSTGTATTGVPNHIMTADYLAGYYGTKTVTPSQAAPHLTWAQTNIADSTAIAAAGIKTQVYVDPITVETTNPIYPYVKNTPSAFEYNCSGVKVTQLVGSTTMYVLNPANSTVRSAFNQYTSSAKSSGHVDMVWEDGVILPSGAPYPNGMPCNYSASTWASENASLNQYSAVPVIENGLNLWTSTTLSPVIGVVNSSSNTIGGNMEHCYTDNTRIIQYGTAFIQVENTALQTTNHGKYFECMARNSNSASSQITARIFTLASFLMTYDVNHSVLQEEFTTPSGLHVFPESQLVPMNPVVAQPSSISGLRTSNGVYARQYNNCYLAGVNKGACVVAVNNDDVTHSFPYSGYGHSLTISGSGILDGGTVSTSGPAPGSMGPGAAVIAFK